MDLIATCPACNQIKTLYDRQGSADNGGEEPFVYILACADCLAQNGYELGNPIQTQE